MIKNKKYLACLISLVLCFAVAFTCFAFIGTEQVLAYGEAQPYETIKSEYSTGERVTVSGAKIVLDGTEYDSQKVTVVYPDGYAYEKDEIVLAQTGIYEVVWSANVANKKVEAKKTFTVRDPAFSVNKETSETYFTNKMLMYQKIPGKKGAESYVDQPGIYASVTDGAKFVYNKPIDVSNLGLDTPFVRIYPYSRSAYYPNGDGWNVEAKKMILRLTDCYDENNYIEVDISYDASNSKYPDHLDPYLRAGASNQIKAGFQPISSDAVVSNKSGYVDGKRYMAQTNKFGARDQAYWMNSGDDTGFEFYFDAETACVYLKTKKLWDSYSSAADGEGEYYYVTYLRNGLNGKYVYDETSSKYVTLADKLAADPDYVATETFDYYGYYVAKTTVLEKDPQYVTNTPNGCSTKEYKADGFTMSKTNTVLIADLDNPDFFDETFGGFKTGEVMLSIYGFDYQTESMRFEIDQIADLSGEELNFGVVRDEKDPIIEIDEKIANAEKRYVVRGDRFTVPAINVLDVNLKSVITEVYYEYGTAGQLRVGLQDGTFVPTKTGSYTVVYTAEDIFGNKTVKELKFSSISSASGKLIDFEADAPDGEIRAGEEVVLPQYQYSALNGDENVTVKVYAVRAGSNDRVEIDAEDMIAFFTGAGKWNVCFEYGDLLASYTYSYELTVISSDNVVFGKEYLPDYFIKGGVYTLDAVTATVYSGANEETLAADVYASEDGGEYKKIDAKAYKVQANENVKFKYVCGTKSFEGTKTVKVVDVGYGEKNALRIKDYFEGDFNKDAKTTYIRFISNKNVGDNTLEFINVLSLDNFVLKFEVPEGQDQFEAIEVKLTDYYDRARFVTLTYEKSGANITFNGVGVKSSFTASKMLEYNSDKKLFKGASNETYTLTEDFTSDKVLLAITLKGINGEAAVTLSSLNGQAINNAKKDTKNPTVWYDPELKGFRSHDEVIEIIPAIPNDVLSPYRQGNFTFTMTNPSGRYVVAEDGTTLDANCDVSKTYYVKLSEYGVYAVTYSYTDDASRVGRFSYKITIVDEVAPELTLKDGYTEKTIEYAKLGATVTVKGWIVSDNISSVENITVNVLVSTPVGGMKQLSGTTFTASEKGDWIVVYTAYDENGNFVSTSYTVRVK